MKSAGKARNNGLYRHIRTSKEIIRNLLNDYHIIHNFRVVSSIIRNYFAFPDIVKPQAVAPEAFRFSYEGGR